MGLQIGIAGAGSITRPHLKGFNQIPGIDRIVVADVNEAALAAVKDAFPDIETTTDYRNLLADPGIALVDVCLPHFLHYPLVMEAFAAGKDVFCEKPIATKLEHAVEMVESAKQRGRKFYVSLNQMFTPAHREAKNMIEQGKLGKLLMGVWKMMGNELGRMMIKDNWKCDIEKSGGGAFFDTGVHAAYVLLDLFGEPLKVSAFTKRLVVPYENKGDDNSVAIIEFKSGAVVTYAQSYTVQSENWNEKKYVYGTEGSLHIDDTSREASLTYFANDCHAGTVVDVEILDSLWVDTLVRSVVHHMDCYMNDKPPLYETKLAIDATRLILALYRSSETGLAVAVAAMS